MDWARIPYFLAVARTGSLRAAAETIGGNHATVDRNLRGLETTYGVRLFDRSTAGLSLTSAGEALLPVAEEAEQSMIAARMRLQGLDREAAGTVRLSIPTPFAVHTLPPILSRFCNDYPEIQLDVSVTNRFEDISRAEADVSVRVAFQVDDDVVGRKLFQYNTGIFASPSYLERHFEARGPKGDGLHWVGWGDVEAVPDWVKNSPFPRASLRHNLRDPMLIKELVRGGQGMSYLPVSWTHEVDGLRQVPGTDITPNRSVWLLLHSDLRRTTRVRLLVDYLARELKALKPKFLHASRSARL
ncbi:Transcriptional regulator, LysR family [Candidatus Rhodobacter oscarellae]|uniref:Transcriptional regulator, LysR family n=1 Tax=Candidatus Rhodobacter oscarellae TaxID=1675527 RepID=A0A0J9E2V0_9RHOB|nr:LysR family transcriptional regulator [Candidatus Rhodobacter lobularis]KMW57037.1 Transcriptional regulator, LysR family [Candidatus Rhodobacter lobularis]